MPFATRRFPLTVFFGCAVLLLVFSARLVAATDTLLFTNGDRLTGQLVRADGRQITFDSPMLGRITVPWSKVESLTTDRPFVVLGKEHKLLRGTLQADSKQLRVESAPDSASHQLDVADTNLIVPPEVYAHSIAASPRPWQNWKGSIAGGLSLVNATQTSRNYTASLAFERPVPELDWLPDRSDTRIAFQGSYGTLSQPGQPTLRTDILNLSLEQDQYLHGGFFTFGSTQFNHNLAQGLDLQQAYGAGLGWKRTRGDVSELDLKADLHFTRQAFLDAPSDRFLASSYSETWMRKFQGEIVWTESLSATPSYTQGLAYQFSGMTSLVVPVYRQLSLNTTLVDSYIGNPQPGFQNNSLQFSSGIQFNFQP